MRAGLDALEAPIGAPAKPNDEGWDAPPRGASPSSTAAIAAMTDAQARLWRGITESEPASLFEGAARQHMLRLLITAEN